VPRCLGSHAAEGCENRSVELNAKTGGAFGPPKSENGKTGPATSPGERGPPLHITKGSKKTSRRTWELWTGKTGGGQTLGDPGRRLTFPKKGNFKGCDVRDWVCPRERRTFALGRHANPRGARAVNQRRDQQPPPLRGKSGTIGCLGGESLLVKAEKTWKDKKKTTTHSNNFTAPHKGLLCCLHQVDLCWYFPEWKKKNQLAMNRCSSLSKGGRGQNPGRKEALKRPGEVNETKRKEEKAGLGGTSRKS